MHEVLRRASTGPQHPPVRFAAPVTEGWTFHALLRVLLRRSRFVLATTTLFVTAALLYTLLAPDRFTATAELIPDTKPVPPVPTEAARNPTIEPAIVENQIETIRSDRMALAVIEEQGLWHDPEFVDTGPNVVARLSAVLGLISPIPGGNEAVQRQIAVNNFHRMLSVTLVGHSYVTAIAFSSRDPNKAAAIANALAAAYIRDQLGARFEIAERTRSWAEERIAELRKQAGDAAQQAEDYKAANGTASDRLRVLQAHEHRLTELANSLENRFSRIADFVQQQSLPVTEARIVTQAMPPLNRSSPKTATLLLLGLATGLTAGVGGAFAREYFDQTISRPEQIEEILQLRCFGRISRVRESSAAKKTKTTQRRAAPGSIPSPIYLGLALSADETLRGTRIALDEITTPSSGRVIAIASAEAGVGKSTLALALTMSLTAGQRRTLLLDADFHNPTLTRGLAQEFNGCGQSAADQTSPTLTIVSHPAGFDFIGRPASLKVAVDGDALGSRAMEALIIRLRKAYDYIIIDTPAMLRHVDLAEAATAVDAVVFVIECGRTRIDDIVSVLRVSTALADRVVGALINKAMPPVSVSA